jgi:hypothetical protein
VDSLHFNLDQKGSSSGSGIKTYEEFEAAFLEQFKCDDNESMRLLQELRTCVQGENEEVEAFVARVERKAATAQVPKEEIFFTVHAGLRRNLMDVVRQHDVQDLRALVKWAVVAEKIANERNDTNSELLAQVRELRRLFEENTRTLRINATGEPAPRHPYYDQRHGSYPRGPTEQRTGHTQQPGASFTPADRQFDPSSCIDQHHQQGEHQRNNGAFRQTFVENSLTCPGCGLNIYCAPHNM